MHHGSLRRSILLPSESIENSYSPDGLHESDIDALLAESGLVFEPVDLDGVAEREAATVVTLRDVSTSKATPPQEDVA